MTGMRLFYGPTDALQAAAHLTTGATRAVEEVVDLVELVGRAGDLMGRAEGLVDRAEATLARAGAQLDASSAALARATTAATRAERLLGDTERLLAPVRELADEALPKVSRLAESVDADEITAAVAMLDRLPRLVAHLEDDVLPMLGQLEAVGPDVHAILESVTDLSTAIRGLPGMGLLQRRGERKEDEGE